MKKYLFKKVLSTGDENLDPRLLTHYYRNDFETVKSMVYLVCEELGYVVDDYVEQYQEVVIDTNKTDLTAIINKVSYYETAVDLHISSRYLIPFGRTINIINKFYQELDQRLVLLYKGKKS